jgi:hypothetical protein
VTRATSGVVAGWRGTGLALAAVLLPWTWFLWRDAAGGVHATGAAQSALDTASILLPLWAVGGALAALLFAGLGRGRRLRTVALVVSVSWLVFALTATVGPWLPTDGRAPVAAVRVVAVSLSEGNRTAAAVSSVVGARGDVVFTSETNSVMYRRLTRRLGEPRVSAGNPGTCSVSPGTCGAVNVWSSFPMRQRGPQRAARDLGGVRLVGSGPGGTFVFYALDAPEPDWVERDRDHVSPAEHRRRLAALLDEVESERLPVVIAGDLKMSDRISAYRAFADQLDDAMRASRTRPTSTRWQRLPLLLRIDHVFVSGHWCSGAATSFGVPGSDHRGLAVDIGPCPKPR